MEKASIVPFLCRNERDSFNAKIGFDAEIRNKYNQVHKKSPQYSNTEYKKAIQRIAEPSFVCRPQTA